VGATGRPGGASRDQCGYYETRPLEMAHPSRFSAFTGNFTGAQRLSKVTVATESFGFVRPRRAARRLSSRRRHLLSA